jgi:predicted dithiol-disulfide oxidoreductase (DUF899 family)
LESPSKEIQFEEGQSAIQFKGEVIMAKTTLESPKVVSQAEWLAAHKQFLSREKELTHLSDRLAQERRTLPWVRVEKSYTFDTPAGKKTLAELFDGRSQLAIYHFMFGPEWKEGCPSCSMAADHFDGNTAHLAQRDVTFMAISRASLPQIEAFKQRMGWRFPWVSSSANDFNRDFHVSFTKEDLARDNIYNFGTTGFPSDEAPGMSVFYKDAAGSVFHTFSGFGRGLEALLGVYTFLDRVPKGRDEYALPHPMAWVRHHDRYENTPNKSSASASLPKAAAAGCCAEHK